jgi:hypothetical protein
MEQLLIQLNIRNESNFISESGVDFNVFNKILSFTQQDPKDLFMVLNYFKTYNGFNSICSKFDFCEKTIIKRVWKGINCLYEKLPKINLIDRLNGLEEIKNSYFPQCFCAVDTTECQISSSENFKQQKLFFSGKKHKTTLKYQTICDLTYGLFLFLNLKFF